jgi:hypothetical protein
MIPSEQKASFWAKAECGKTLELLSGSRFRDPFLGVSNK